MVECQGFIEEVDSNGSLIFIWIREKRAREGRNTGDRKTSLESDVMELIIVFKKRRFCSQFDF